MLKYLRMHPDVEGHDLGETYVLNAGRWSADNKIGSGKDGPSNEQCSIFQLYQKHYEKRGSIDAVERGQKYIDKTPRYLFQSHEVPQRLLCADSNAKMIVVLRNPVDRAYSAYNMDMQNLDIQEFKKFRSLHPGGKYPTFEEAIANEIVLLREDGLLNLNMTPAEQYQVRRNSIQDMNYNPEGMHPYIAMSLYHIQLRQWLAVLRDHFGPDKMMDHILIMESEADRENKQGAYDRVLDFLDLVPYDLSKGGTEEIKDEHVRSYDHAMSAETRKDLEAFFRPHNARLHELLSPLGVEISWAKQAYLEMAGMEAIMQKKISACVKNGSKFCEHLVKTFKD